MRQNLKVRMRQNLKVRMRQNLKVRMRQNLKQRLLKCPKAKPQHQMASRMRQKRPRWQKGHSLRDIFVDEGRWENVLCAQNGGNQAFVHKVKNLARI
jgi:hypothetical protein